MDRRSFLTGTTAASAAAALAPSFPSLGATEEAALYEAAKQDGEVIWYTAQFDTPNELFQVNEGMWIEIGPRQVALMAERP